MNYYFKFQRYFTGSEKAMYILYMTHCVEHNNSYVSWSFFLNIIEREHIGFFKFDKFSSEEVPLLKSYKDELFILDNQGKIVL